MQNSNKSIYKILNFKNMTILRDELKSSLLPLYKELLSGNTFDNVCTFCVQWGKNFPDKKNTGILFIGKAVNGWINDETDVNVLFGDSSKKIFDICDQMEWVYNLEGNNDGYNTNKSSFWRVIKRISQKFYQNEEWYSYIAWSNLCKIAPFKGGNPNDMLYNEQLSSCQKILAKEIEIFSPKFVVMLTSGWENDFLYYLNGNIHTKSEEKLNWDDYQTKLYKIKDTIYIASQHPQGKNEKKHIDVITNLINKY